MLILNIIERIYIRRRQLGTSKELKEYKGGSKGILSNRSSTTSKLEVKRVVKLKDILR